MNSQGQLHEIMLDLKSTPDRIQSDWIRLLAYLSAKYGDDMVRPILDRMNRIRAIKDSHGPQGYSPYGNGNPYY